jgi:hypothetical protein
MAVQTNSDLLAQTYATSPQQNATYLSNADSHLTIATNATLVADGNGSQYRVCQVNSGDCITALSYINDALSTGASYKLGLYEANSTTAANSVSANAALFTATTSMVAATTAFTSVRFAVQAPSTANKRVWELLGLASDPKKAYDLCWTVIAVGAAGGNVITKYEYTR